MKKLVLLAFLGLASMATQAQTYCYIEGISVNPENPTTSDEVCLTISGELSGATKFIESLKYSVNGFDVDLEINAGVKGGFGILMMIEFDTTICLGQLPEGEYTINISGNYSGDYLVDPDDAFFTVSAPANPGGEPGTQLGINEGEKTKKATSLFPNPVVENLTVELAENTGEALLLVYALDGKLVYSKNLNLQKTSHDLSHLFSGIYFVRIQDPNGEILANRKILVSH